jgi:hypothetical protein
MERGFWEVACGYQWLVQMFTVVVFTFGILTVISFPFLQPGTAAHTVALLNFSYIGVFLVFIGLYRYKCGTARVDDV